MPVFAVAQTGGCAKAFEAAMKQDGHLSIDLRSGDVEITGAKIAAVRVTCTSREKGVADTLRVSLAAGHLRVYGGPTNIKSLHIRIEVPERTGLLVRASAGNVDLAGVTGDKDVELQAGNLTMQVGDPKQYRVAEGSVMAGDLRAPAFNVKQDGLFGSFRKDTTGGLFRLRAKLMAGNLTLK